jgi:hypothetical protein
METIMNRTFLVIALAANLTVGAAFAQTSTTATTPSDPASTTYGSDWSATLGPAMFGADGTTLRPDAELVTQWGTLSVEDKAMIQRDCMAHMAQSGTTTGGATGTTGATTTTTTATTPTTGTTTGSTSAATTGSAMPMSVSAEQMDKICTATKDL